MDGRTDGRRMDEMEKGRKTAYMVHKGEDEITKNRDIGREGDQ